MICAFLRIRLTLMQKVFFCTSSEPPLTFREALKADYLGSPLRRHMLSSLPTREVNVDLLRDPSKDGFNSQYLLTDSHNPLVKLQREQGQVHWKRMYSNLVLGSCAYFTSSDEASLTGCVLGDILDYGQNYDFRFP